MQDFNVKKMGIQWLVRNNHSVAESDFSVARSFAKRIKELGLSYTKDQRKQIMKFAVECHQENKRFYREVMG